MASALAASALPGLVFGRGHAIASVPEIPLVIDSAVESVTKTKQAIGVLKAIGAYDDVEKAADSKKLRAGKGKMRGRKHVQRRGPLVVYAEDHGVTRAFRNLPGVETAHVDRLNLLQLAPGGHLGRFVIWSADAFERVNAVWGSVVRESATKKGYTLPRPIMLQSDLTRLINCDEVQSELRHPKTGVTRAYRKKNPLVNLGVKLKLNPYASVLRRSELLTQERAAKARAAKVEGKRAELSKKQQTAAAERKQHRKVQSENYKRLIKDDLPVAVDEE